MMMNSDTLCSKVIVEEEAGESAQSCNNKGKKKAQIVGDCLKTVKGQSKKIAMTSDSRYLRS